MAFASGSWAVTLRLEGGGWQARLSSLQPKLGLALPGCPVRENIPPELKTILPGAAPQSWKIAGCVEPRGLLREEGALDRRLEVVE